MSPFTNVYGLTRTLLACSTLSALLFSPANALFRPAVRSVAEVGARTALQRWGLFTLLDGKLELARWIAIALLALVASGWRPRFTGIVHWWVTLSFFTSMVTQDGGDQCAATLTLLLLPVTLCDPRVSHWAPAPVPDTKAQHLWQRIASSAIIATKLQVAVLYLHAAVGKVAVDEWVNGTAVYYWLLDPRVGLPETWHPFALRLLAPEWVAPMLTWLPMLLEFALFASIALPEESPARKPLFWSGFAFHFGTMLFFGLFSFMLAMVGALVILLRPAESAFELPWLQARLAAALDRHRLISWRGRTRLLDA